MSDVLTYWEWEKAESSSSKLIEMDTYRWCACDAAWIRGNTEEEGTRRK